MPKLKGPPKRRPPRCAGPLAFAKDFPHSSQKTRGEPTRPGAGHSSSRAAGLEQSLAYCSTFFGLRSAAQKGINFCKTVFVVLALLVSAFVYALEPGDHQRSLVVNGEPRSYVLHLPPLKHTRPLALVLMLHGAGGNAAHIEAATGMSTKADEAGFAVAYPNGSTAFSDLLRTWNAGNCCGLAAAAGVDDVAFLRAVLKDVKAAVAIDRVFAAGFSNGGMMAYRLACELRDEIAAVAVVAATYESACKPRAGIPVLAIHGLLDGLLRFDGIEQENSPLLHATRSVPESVAVFARANGCSGAPTVSEDSRLRDARHFGCKAEVRLISLKHGAHAWPGGRKIYPWEAEPTHEISATGLIWKFFSVVDRQN
jgi:polyhydroxybutyrate depolymerase